MDDPAPVHAVAIDAGEIEVVVRCVKQCTDKTCGDDGCGGICGICGEGELCDELTQVCCENDLDGDGVCDENDCAPDDSGSFADPSGVEHVWFVDAMTLSWTPADGGNGTLYDVCRGTLDELPFGTGPAETCVENDLDATEAQVESPPTPGMGYYFLVRANNSCGIGTYGQDSSGGERNSDACQ